MTEKTEATEQAQELVQITEQDASISKQFGYTQSEIAVIRNTVAKGTSKVELAFFINVCRSMQLNPFNKEVWCYKDGQGNLIIFAGRDGFLAKAQKHPDYAGMRSAEICEKDEFEIDIPNGVVHHKIKSFDRGAILAAYAFVFRKGGEPTVELATFKNYDKGYNTWKSHPAEMIKKVAESHALKKAFGISGVQSEYDFEIRNGVAVPNNTVDKNIQYSNAID